MGVAGYLFGATLVIREHTHLQPPVTRGTGKFVNPGGVIAASQMVAQLGGGLFVVEAPICTAQRPPWFSAAGVLRSSTRTVARPGRQTSTALAAASDKSIMRPGMNGPRSVMRTTTE